MNKQLILEKYIKVAIKKALKEQEEQQQKAERAMYLIHRFPGLKKVMEDLMSPAFGRYVNDIKIIAPKPTTFQISLTNGQDFSVKYLGKKQFDIKVSGKKYNPINLGELERASQAVADLLELNYALETGKEQQPSDTLGNNSRAPEAPGTSAAELGPDLAAADSEPALPTAAPAAPGTPPAPGTAPAAPEIPTPGTPEENPPKT
jgi:hypothetical protein